MADVWLAWKPVPRKEPPLVYAHGMPGSSLEALFFHEQARVAGFRILALDRKILAEPEQVRRFRNSQLECLNSGARAIATDLFTEMGDWGFRLAQVPVRTLIWQGVEDRLLPPAYAHHLAASLPDAALRTLPHSGHCYPLDKGFQADLFDRIRSEAGP